MHTRFAAALCVVLVLALAPAASRAQPATRMPAPSGAVAGARFVPSPRQPAMYLFARPEEAALRTARGQALGTARGQAGRPDVRAIPGFPAPNAMTRYGSRLYVSNYVDLYSGYLQVVDIAVPGSEFITGVITAPVNTFDLAVVDGVLYAVGQSHGDLYERPLSGGEWISTTVRKNTSDVFEYGHLLTAYGRRLLVNHPWENAVDVFSLDTHAVERSLTDFEYGPSRAVFAGDYLVVVEIGLSQPDCASYGPHYAVYQLPGYTRIARHSLQGDCPMDVVVRGDRLYVMFVNGVRIYDLLTGQALAYLPIFPVGWHALDTGRELIVQQYWDGALYLVDYSLTHIITTYGLITPPNYWTPPIEEMAAMPVLTDGRVFVTNRDNSALSIVDLPLGPAWTQWLPAALRLGVP